MNNNALCWQISVISSAPCTLPSAQKWARSYEVHCIGSRVFASCAIDGTSELPPLFWDKLWQMQATAVHRSAAAELGNFSNTDSTRFKNTRFIYGESKPSVPCNVLGLVCKVFFHQLPQYSTSCKLVSRKTNLLSRVTSLSFIRERKIPSTANCHILQSLIYDSPGVLQ